MGEPEPDGLPAASEVSYEYELNYDEAPPGPMTEDEVRALADAVGGTTKPGPWGGGWLAEFVCVLSTCQLTVTFNTIDYFWTEDRVRRDLQGSWKMEITDGGWMCTKHG